MGQSTDYSHLAKPTKVIQGNFQTWMRCTLHLLPLTFAAVILSINFKPLYWFPVSGTSIGQQNTHLSTTNIINLLQLTAKLYEILVVASLGAIALEVSKRHLVHNGIPFGLLTGAYRISDIYCITSSRFWSAASKNLKLSMLFLLCLILCTFIGPASAILIVPKLGWFPLPNAFSNIYMPMYQSYHHLLWPTILNSSFVNDNWKICRQKSGIYQIHCPASGFSQIFAWSSGWKVSGIPDNITFEDPATETSRRLDILPSNSLENSPGTFLTCLTAITSRTLGRFQAYFNSHDIGDISSTETYRLNLTSSSINYQPLVNAKCNVWTRHAYNNVSEVPVLYYPSEELNCYSDFNECVQMRNKTKGKQVSQRVWSAKSLMVSFNAVGGENLNQNSTEHLIKNSPSILTFTGSIPYLHKGQRDMRIFACTYMAHWIPSSLTLNPSIFRSIESNITDLALFSNRTKFEKARSRALVGPPIRITTSWLPFLNLDAIESGKGRTKDKDAVSSVARIISTLTYRGNVVGGPRYFGPGSSLAQPEADRVAGMTIEKVTGALVTDAIARTGSMYNTFVARPNEHDTSDITAVNLGAQQTIMNRQVYFFSNGTTRGVRGVWETGLSPHQALEKWAANRIQVSYNAERFGYGYGNLGVGMIFAIIVNLLYMVLVLVYCLRTIYYRADSVLAFDDLQDLINIAWKSPKIAEIEHQGIEIVDNKLWKKFVIVGATSSGSVEMDLVESIQNTKLSRLVKDIEYC